MEEKASGFAWSKKEQPDSFALGLALRSCITLIPTLTWRALTSGGSISGTVPGTALSWRLTVGLAQDRVTDTQER